MRVSLCARVCVRAFGVGDLCVYTCVCVCVCVWFAHKPACMSEACWVCVCARLCVGVSVRVRVSCVCWCVGTSIYWRQSILAKIPFFSPMSCLQSSSSNKHSFSEKEVLNFRSCRVVAFSKMRQFPRTGERRDRGVRPGPDWSSTHDSDRGAVRLLHKNRGSVHFFGLGAKASGSLDELEL